MLFHRSPKTLKFNKNLVTMRFTNTMSISQNTFESDNVREAVKVPKGEDENSWITANTIEFYNQISILYYSIQDDCTADKCPKMTIGKYEYFWNEKGRLLPLTAPAYADATLCAAEECLERLSAHPDAARTKVSSVLRRLFRLYGHIYCAHFDAIKCNEEDQHLNTSFKYFVLFVREFKLIDEKEFKPMEKLIMEIDGAENAKIPKDIYEKESSMIDLKIESSSERKHQQHITKEKSKSTTHLHDEKIDTKEEQKTKTKSESQKKSRSIPQKESKSKRKENQPTHAKSQEAKIHSRSKESKSKEMQNSNQQAGKLERQEKSQHSLKNKSCSSLPTPTTSLASKSSSSSSKKHKQKERTSATLLKQSQTNFHHVQSHTKLKSNSETKPHTSTKSDSSEKTSQLTKSLKEKESKSKTNLK